MRAVVIVVGGLVLAGLGVVLLSGVFVARDEPTFSAVRGPGKAYRDLGARHVQPGTRSGPFASDPPTSGPHVPAPVTRDGGPLTDDQLVHALELGDVVLFYGERRPPAGLRRLADDVAGPFDPKLAEAGQSVILARRPGTRGVIAAAWGHLLPVSAPDDPALRDFVDFWLGRGAGSG